MTTLSFTFDEEKKVYFTEFVADSIGVLLMNRADRGLVRVYMCDDGLESVPVHASNPGSSFACQINIAEVKYRIESDTEVTSAKYSGDVSGGASGPSFDMIYMTQDEEFTFDEKGFVLGESFEWNSNFVFMYAIIPADKVGKFSNEMRYTIEGESDVIPFDGEDLLHEINEEIAGSFLEMTGIQLTLGDYLSLFPLLIVETLGEVTEGNSVTIGYDGEDYTYDSTNFSIIGG